VNQTTDQKLLGEFARNRSEEAFAELVRRHIDLVHSAAVRMVCDSHLAQDVTQGVFVALAENARPLIDHAVLSGWLHRTTRNLAANVVRSEVRRRAREQESVAMHTPSSGETEDVWSEIAPELDAALGDLSEADRDAVLLRYFERKSAAETAAMLGLSEDAAQKRVGRAVERLRGLLSKRGVGVGAGSVAALLSANAVQAAPLGLVASVSTSALVGITTSTVSTAATTLVMTTLQKTAITLVVAASVGTGIYEAKLASRLGSEADAWRRERTDMAAQIAALDQERHDRSNYVAALREDNDRLGGQLGEFLRLQGEVLKLRHQARVNSAAKEAASAAAPIPDYFKNAMATGMKTATDWKAKHAAQVLERMKQKLGLRPNQEEKIRTLMLAKIQEDSDRTLQVMSGELTPDAAAKLRQQQTPEEAQILALLDGQQLQSYTEFKAEETVTAAQDSARSTTDQIRKTFDLSDTQADQVYGSLYQLNLADQTGNTGKATGEGDPSAQVSAVQEQHLNRELNVLSGLVDPVKLEKYRTEKQADIDRMAEMLKSLMPANGKAVKP
jgi:RNA polymerase sigma factor (sigma-70 family)